MGECAAISAAGGFEANGVGFLDPFLHADLVAVETGLTPYYGEFAVIKIGVENGLPDAGKLHRVTVSEPIRDKNSPSFALSMSVSEM